MVIAFTCPGCMTPFRVPDRVAGKTAKCKKCGGTIKIPAAPAAVAASVAATGVFRMGAVQSNRPQAAMAAEHPIRPAAPSSLQLAPITEDRLPKMARKKPNLWEEDDSVEYELAKPTSIPKRSLPKKRASNPLYSPPRGGFWGRGGLGETMLLSLNKISDFAYLISIPFLLLILVAIVLKERPLAIGGAAIVILLNVGRLAVDGFALATLAFKNGPVHGVLFFIPPFTFYYLSKRGRVMKNALGRFLSPLLPIVGVVLLFVFVTWLRGSDEAPEGSIEGRIQHGLGVVEEKMGVVEEKIRDKTDMKKTSDNSNPEAD